MLSSSSSDGFSSFSMLNGDTSVEADFVASFRFGDNRAEQSGWHEYMVCDANGAGESAQGHLVWDPLYEGPGSPLFSVAPVRLDVSAGEIRWSVGTNDFLVCKCKPFRSIDRIQVAALAGRSGHHRLVQWDLIDLTCHFADGGRDRRLSPCLPKAAGNQAMRRAKIAGPASPSPFHQQYTEISLKGAAVTRIQIRGQVTLRAEHQQGNDLSPLGADDLQGRILVFTDAATHHTDRAQNA
jgi:hypothetical protein